MRLYFVFLALFSFFCASSTPDQVAFWFVTLQIWGVGGEEALGEALEAREKQREYTAAQIHKARQVGWPGYGTPTTTRGSLRHYRSMSRARGRLYTWYMSQDCGTMWPSISVSKAKQGPLSFSKVVDAEAWVLWVLFVILCEKTSPSLLSALLSPPPSYPAHGNVHNARLGRFSAVPSTARVC